MSVNRAPLPLDLALTHALAFGGDDAWSAADFAGFLGQPGVILSGTADAFVLGRVTLDEAEVLTLATHPARRRHGLARTALAHFCASAAAAGAVSVFLEVAADNAAALALYHSAGFARVGHRRGYYHRPGQAAVDALILRRACNAPL